MESAKGHVSSKGSFVQVSRLGNPLVNEVVDAFRKSPQTRGGTLIRLDLVWVLFTRAHQLRKACETVRDLGVACTLSRPENNFRAGDNRMR